MAIVVDRTSPGSAHPDVLARVEAYPRFRYMGSKRRVIPHLLDVIGQLEFYTALDAFSGTGVVAYALKALGKSVVANDYLAFAMTVARATVENDSTTLSLDEIDAIASGENVDGRDFIQKTFQGVFFNDVDNAFLDSAWSQVSLLSDDRKKAIATSALCLAAVRKQPRGVFTVAGVRNGIGYDDGRRNLSMRLSDQFRLAAEAINACVFDNGSRHRAIRSDITLPPKEAYDLVYLDPPYSPPQYDNDYIKRYHFLEGLTSYWQGEVVLSSTKTRKLPKRYTPFGYQKTFLEALGTVFDHFRNSHAVILSHSTNSWLTESDIVRMIRNTRTNVQVFAVPYKYTFGTHPQAMRRSAHELIFVAT